MVSQEPSKDDTRNHCLPSCLFAPVITCRNESIDSVAELFFGGLRPGPGLSLLDHAAGTTPSRRSVPQAGGVHALAASTLVSPTV